MCSQNIINNLSCYIDNFGLILEPVVAGLTMGIILGTVVGLLLLFIRKN